MTSIFIIGLVVMTLMAVAWVVLPLLKQRMFITSLLLMILLPAFSLMLYFYCGNSRGLLDYFFHIQQETVIKAELKNPQAVVDALKAYLDSHPHSPQGWYLLGKMFLNAGDYKRAVDALNNAHSQASENIDYATAYAEALFFNHQRRLVPEAQQLLLQVLQRDTNNIAANNLLAINAYNVGQYHKAIHYWEKLIPLFDLQSKDEKMLLQMIYRAQQKLK